MLQPVPGDIPDGEQEVAVGQGASRRTSTPPNAASGRAAVPHRDQHAGRSVASAGRAETTPP